MTPRDGEKFITRAPKELFNFCAVTNIPLFFISLFRLKASERLFSRTSFEIHYQNSTDHDSYPSGECYPPLVLHAVKSLDKAMH